MTLPDVDTLSTYGGALNNLGGVQDPTTDRDAGAMNSALESVAQMTHTAGRAVCRVTFDSATPTIGFNDAGWGSITPPSVARAALGTFDITWPATIVDGLSASHNLLLRWALVKLECPAGVFPGFAYATMRAANVVRIYTFTLSGGTAAASDLAGQTAILLVG